MAGDSEWEQGMADAGLNEIFKKQVWRKLAALPEEKQYEVLDFIDFLCSEYADRSAPRADALPVRLLTHNVWHYSPDPASIAQAIIDARPDVAMLQEVNGSFRPMLPALDQHFAYTTTCPPGCDLVIFSRWPIADSDYFLKDAAGRKFGPAMLWARIAGPGGRHFTAVTLHYPRPTSRDQAVRRRDVAQALARIDRDPLIVAGDMNLTPWAAAMREQDRAFAPLIRMTRTPSWPRAFPVLPIDHLYAGPDWGLVSARQLPAT